MSREKKWPQAPWEYIGNSWQYTTIYAENRMPIARLDLEDWSVNEANQSYLEDMQTATACLIAKAPELVERLEVAVGIIDDLAEYGNMLDEGTSNDLEDCRKLLAEIYGDDQ